MRYHLFLADSAEVAGGKLFVLGGGIQTAQNLPIPLAICGTIVIPWDETNKVHTLTVLLESAAELAVMVQTPQGDQPFKIETQFESGRPPGARKGSAFTAPFAVNFLKPDLAVGRYVFRILSDGFEVDILPLDVVDNLVGRSI